MGIGLNLKLFVMAEIVIIRVKVTKQHTNDCQLLVTSAMLIDALASDNCHYADGKLCESGYVLKNQVTVI